MRDGRILSRSRPSTPSCMNRSRQRQTHVLDVVRSAHDLAGADPGGAQKYDLGTLDVLLRGVAILANPLETFAVRGREVDSYTTAHR